MVILVVFKVLLLVKNLEILIQIVPDNPYITTGVFNRSDYCSMNGIKDTKNDAAILKNDERMYVYLKGSHFQQNNILTSNNDHVINTNVINIYCVSKLDPIALSRDKSFTIQNALFGVMQITKNANDNSKDNYKGYAICFDERSEFGHTISEDGFTHIQTLETF